MKMINRYQGIYKGRSKSVSYKNLIWTVATSPNTNLHIKEQTQQTLDQIENNLIEQGSSKFNITSAQIYLANINDKNEMDNVWNNWIGNDPEYWPQRACLGVQLEGNTLIEITVTAVIA